MYDTQFVADRIKTQAKNVGCTMKIMLSDLGLGVNTVSHLAKGQEISYLNLAKIADYLDCSIDYLLGRTDNPQIQSNIITTGNINGSNNANMNISSTSPISDTGSTIKLDEMETNLLQSFRNMEFSEKLKVVSDVMEKTKK